MRVSPGLSAARSITARIAFMARALRSSGNGRPPRRRQNTDPHLANLCIQFFMDLFASIIPRQAWKINSIPNIFPGNRALIPLFFRPRHHAGHAGPRPDGDGRRAACHPVADVLQLIPSNTRPTSFNATTPGVQGKHSHLDRGRVGGCVRGKENAMESSCHAEPCSRRHSFGCYPHHTQKKEDVHYAQRYKHTPPEQNTSMGVHARIPHRKD